LISVGLHFNGNMTETCLKMFCDFRFLGRVIRNSGRFIERNIIDLEPPSRGALRFEDICFMLIISKPSSVNAT
jgi:hypothetical protein